MSEPRDTRVYLTLESARGHLVIDGPLSLLREFLRLWPPLTPPDPPDGAEATEFRSRGVVDDDG